MNPLTLGNFPRIWDRGEVSKMGLYHGGLGRGSGELWGEPSDGLQGFMGYRDLNCTIHLKIILDWT